MPRGQASQSLEIVSASNSNMVLTYQLRQWTRFAMERAQQIAQNST